MAARKLFRRSRRGRDSASFGAAALGVLLLAGAAFGTGVARTAVEVADGLTWLPDDPRGEVVQVNPASGRPETRLRVAGGDAELEITQKDGVLVVLDRRTGQITVIDLATLLASGRRQAAKGDASKVLVSEGRIYVVDRAAGTVSNADPVTLVDVGEQWRAGQPLADVVADDAGVVWAADNGGNLYELAWSDDESRFVERSRERVRGGGPGAVLVPHDRGVTLFGLDDGVVVRVGTGKDLTGTTGRLSGHVLAATSSPAGLAPVAVPGQGAVVIVSDDRVVRVDVAALGCATPGRPVVFRDGVYVPCRGKVIVLNGSGDRAGPDVDTPGDAEPELVADDGRLFISAPGAERGVVVDSDGSKRPVTIRTPDVPVVDPDRPPRPDVPTPPRPTPRPEEPADSRDSRDEPRAPNAPGPGQPTAAPPAAGAGQPPGAPPGVTVMLSGRTAEELTATVSWGSPADNGATITGYTVVANGEFTGGSRTARTAETSVSLTFPCGGSMFCVNGRLDVSVTAANRAGSGAPGTRTWNVPPQQAGPTNPPPPTTTQPPQQPPPTTTQPPQQPPPQQPPPQQPPPTTEEPPRPPPVTLPAAGAAVITGSSAPNGAYDSVRRITMSPPGDWATHDGRCELVNVTHGYNTPIGCSATSAEIHTELGSNRIVVRAYASDGSRSVDSAVRSVQGPREPMCGKYLCLGDNKIVELSPTRSTVPAGQVGTGVGLLVLAVVLRLAGRRENDQS